MNNEPTPNQQELDILNLISQAVERSIKSITFREAVRDTIYECAPELSRNMPFMLQISETLKAARWVSEHMPLHKVYTHENLRKLAITNAPDEGLYLEFGVWKAHWLNIMAAMKPVQFYGFDSFEGIPEDWSIYPKNHFSLGGFMPRVLENVSLIKGWFDQTLPPFLENHKEMVSFIHIDCDLYSSTKTILDCLRPRLRVGTIIVLDDYFIEPGWDKAEFLAFNEFITFHKIGIEYMGYVSDTPSTAVAVKLTSVPKPDQSPEKG